MFRSWYYIIHNFATYNVVSNIPPLNMVGYDPYVSYVRMRGLVLTSATNIE